ncbi:augurin-B [Alosa sapidissima]|uniref:augurin-B n=1 Tax=Alosa sapidissima TaxID=34773 RepID=UPI001C0A0C86|nr:augurin-B [Alosa sapidissima]
MALQQRLMQLLLLITLFSVCSPADSTGDENLLKRLLKKRDVAEPPKSPSSVAVAPAKAKEFLASLRRAKRNIWDRSRPDVQQWIMQFMYMGYDEARLETDLSYWMDQSRSRDHTQQHHYDENSPTGHHDPRSYRYGANVNYDYY